MARVIIIGGGISGLALAFRLQQSTPDAEVIVLEQRSRTGGVIDSLSRDGYLVEAGPNGFLDTNPVTLELARELNLNSRLIPASESAGRNRFLFLDGRLRLLPNNFVSFLRSDLLSWIAKIEVLAERFKPRRKDFADESIDSFVRRRAGREIARNLADAFVTGILAGDPKLLSVQASFPRLAGFERDHGSVLRGMAASRKSKGVAARAKMWSFHGGLSVLVHALTSALRHPPETGVIVRRVHPEGDRWRVEAEGRSWDCDAVVLACPAYGQAAILDTLDRDLAQKLAGIAYNRIAVVALGYRKDDVPHSLDGFGYLSPQRQRRDVLGTQWCSSIFPGRAPDGHVLMRALCGGWHRANMVDWPDDNLVAVVRAEMARTVGVKVAPRFTQVVRWDRAIPQYMVGHLDRIAEIERLASAHRGLFLAGSAYRGVAINDCVEQANIAAGSLAAYISTKRR